MNVAVPSVRGAEIDARLRARIERLQRLLDADFGGGATGDDKSEGGPVPATCRPPPLTHPPLGRRPFDASSETGNAWVQGTPDRAPLLPFPGYPNASLAHSIEACIGVSLLGAAPQVWNEVLLQLQARLATSQRRYTYFCITDCPDFSYFIQRGITFEYIGYLDRLGDPKWRDYFERDISLIKAKYGVRDLMAVGDPKYAV